MLDTEQNVPYNISINKRRGNMTEKKRIELLLKKGQKFHCAGLICMQIFLISLAVFIITLVLMAITGDNVYLFEDILTLWRAVVVYCILLIVSLIGMAGLPIGFILYCVGLHFIGLGQIAKNTYKGSEEIEDDDGVHYI